MGVKTSHPIAGAEEDSGPAPTPLPRKRGRPRLLLPVSGGLLFAALGASLWAGTRRPPPMQARRLPDGSRVTLEAVTRGPVHRFVDGGWLQKQLYPLLPPAIAERLRISVPEVTTPPDGLVFWVRHRRSIDHLDVTASDEHGCEYSQTQSPAWAPAQEMERGIVAWPLTTVPRRGKEVGLRLYDTEQDRTFLAEFRVPNPFQGPYPAWTAERLPASRQVGNTRFTLEELTLGAEPPYEEPETAGPNGWKRARFQIAEAGKPVSWWQAVYGRDSLAMSDPTGNQLSPNSATYGYWPDGYRLYIGDRDASILCPGEPVWKLRVEWTRMAAAPFSPEERWEVRDVPVPRPGTRHSLNRRARRQGVDLELTDLAAPHVGLRDWPDTRTSWYALAAKGTPEGQSVKWDLIGLTDSRGRRYEFSRTGTGSRDGASIAFFELRIPASLRKIHVAFSVQRRRVTEYLVSPSRPSADAAP